MGLKAFFKINLFVLLSLGFGFTAADSLQDDVLPQQAAALSNAQRAVIIDVREDDEWREAHIANAIHIPLSRLADKLAELERYKNGTVITQCRSGRRSLKAQQLLQAAGFAHVVNLTGGLRAWTAQGLPTE